MPLEKRTDIELILDSWPEDNPAPQQLVDATAAGPYSVDCLCALLFTALWTRPPIRYGFSLADTWAWLRYFPAISHHAELRLCDSWSTLDPHHKTVLSGDFGVGFTTWFLHRVLQIERFSDTLWVVNTLHPGMFDLGGTAKRGPSKSPDYIAEDRAGNFSVIECKGTQSSRQSLRAAIVRGMPQKANLQAVGATRIHHSLVVGLFVPQFPNFENPLILVGDPDWQEVKQELGRFSREQIGRGISQIAYAKELALLELSETPNTLARTKGSRETITGAFREDLRREVPGRRIEAGMLMTTREYLWPQPAEVGDGLRIVGARFQGELAIDDLERLQTIDSPEQQAEMKREDSRGESWVMTADDTSTVLRSPLGSRFQLSLLEE